MEDPKELFLTAEAQARELAEQLIELKQKMEGHALAEQSLYETRSELSGLIAEMANGAEQTQEMIKTLGKIGTPEILEQLEQVQENMKGGFSTSNDQLLDLRESVESRTSQVRLFLLILLGLNGVLIILQVLSLIIK